jgi:hypothetical protein
MCNLEVTAAVKRRVYLPHAKSTIDLVTHSCVSQTVDLLTDPRIAKDDYLFFDGDPCNGSPEEFIMLDDVNAGQAFRETYKKLIEPEH